MSQNSHRDNPSPAGVHSGEDGRQRGRDGALFEAVLRAQSHGVAVVRQDGRIVYANDSLRRFLGTTEGEPRTVYRAFQWLFPDPQEMARAAALWAESLQEAGGEPRTMRVRSKGEGGDRWMTFEISALDGELMLVQVRDVTEQHRAAKARAELEEQLLQAQKMDAVGTLAGGVAHDMNNVLGVIMGFASVLQQSAADDSGRARCVRGILSASRRGRDLTNNLLGFARKGTFRREILSLNRVVREVGDLLRRTMPKSVELALDLDDDVVDVYVDGGQISHALMNLCLNGVDSMHDGGRLLVRTRTVDLGLDEVASWVSVAPGRYAELLVEDTGAGMDRRTLAHAFEPFFTTKPKGQGTGLGLAMVYGTVRHHEGDIQIDSAPGRGTRVTVLLPEASSVAPRHRPKERPSDPSVTIPARVLVVDDERLMLQAAKVLLRSLGHQVHLTQGGKEAVAFLEASEEDVDLVLLDLLMPGMDGTATFEAMRRIRPDLRVLLCSGFPQGDQAAKLIASGAMGFLRKPFEREQLAEEVNRIMGSGGKPTR